MSGYKHQADLSHWEQEFNASEYPYERVALKATDGRLGDDPTYLTRVKAAHAAGIAVDHYHFGENGDSKAQARHFLAVVRPNWKAGDRFAYDAEANGVDGSSVAGFAKVMRTEEPGWQGLLYGTASFFTAHGIRLPNSWLVWIAHVTKNPQPDMPEGWPAWSLWQYTFSARVRGVEGKCDLSRVAIPPKPKPHGFSPATSTLVALCHASARKLTKTLTGRRAPLRPHAKTRARGLHTALSALVKQLERVIAL